MKYFISLKSFDNLSFFSLDFLLFVKHLIVFNMCVYIFSIINVIIIHTFHFIENYSFRNNFITKIFTNDIFFLFFNI